MAKADSETTDPSGPGVRTTDLITARIFAATSLYTAPEWVMEEMSETAYNLRGICVNCEGLLKM
jgi:hypothetical protein